MLPEPSFICQQWQGSYRWDSCKKKRAAGSTGLSSNYVQAYQRVELSKKASIQKPHTEKTLQAVQGHIALRTWWSFLEEHTVLDPEVSNKLLGSCCWPLLVTATGIQHHGGAQARDCCSVQRPVLSIQGLQNKQFPKLLSNSFIFYLILKRNTPLAVCLPTSFPRYFLQAVAVGRTASYRTLKSGLRRMGRLQPGWVCSISGMHSLRGVLETGALPAMQAYKN